MQRAGELVATAADVECKSRTIAELQEGLGDIRTALATKTSEACELDQALHTTAGALKEDFVNMGGRIAALHREIDDKTQVGRAPSRGERGDQALARESSTPRCRFPRRSDVPQADGLGCVYPPPMLGDVSTNEDCVPATNCF